MYPRYEEMRLQIRQLGTLVQSLQVEIGKRGPNESTLKAKVRELETVIEELQREVPVIPS